MSPQPEDMHGACDGFGGTDDPRPDVDYRDFIAAKTPAVPGAGFDPQEIAPHLFPFQRDIVRWALRRGKAAIFADTGLGKTPMQLEWARQVAQKTGKPVLILAPLAVAKQTARAAGAFGLNVQYVQSYDDVRKSDEPSANDHYIIATNYERLEHFPAHLFGGIVLDESSILKSFDGKTRTRIIEAFQETPYRLACTATPAPNDTTELGNHAEFLGVMTRTEMLAMYFFHDGGDTSKWTLKGHAREAFWKWVASWAVVVRRPSDVHPDYNDEQFKLPPIEYHHHIVPADPNAAIQDGKLFTEPAKGLTEQRKARRETLEKRCALAAQVVIDGDDDDFLVWCELNDEGDLIEDMIPESFQVKGASSDDWKVQSVDWFTSKLACLCHLGKKSRGKTTRLSDTEPIQSTDADGSGNQPNTTEVTESSDASTCESTCESTITENTSKRDERQSESSDLPHDGTSTQPTHACAQSTDATHENGPSETQRNVSPIAFASTDSLSKIIGDSLRSSAADVPSVDPNPTADSASIIAIAKEKSEDFSAPIATSQSGSLVTTWPDCREPCAICGRPKRRVLIAKSKMFGYGLNLQTCHRVIFVGVTHSFESYYQAVRRCYRFGQTRPVRVDIVSSELEGAVLENLQRKEQEAAAMAEEMVSLCRDQMRIELGTMPAPTVAHYNESVKSGKDWTMHLGDCVETVKRMADSSVDFTIFSPPFASLYTYSDSMRDMGNCATHDEFYKHFSYLVPELLRVTKPGRLLSFHCMNLPTSKSRDGFIGISDFRGILIKAFQDAGWIYHSEVCIWKDPVTAMQRTHALGLLYKQLRKDSCMSRQGIPDYLVTMRKPGENPEPVTHTPEDFPVELWQRYASPVWMDIDPSDTLQRESAREHEDERHICPLQLEVIRRALLLWSNPGDLILSPFGGIGSEGYVALQEGRQYVGVELKDSYWKQACLNLEAISVGTKKQMGLFDVSP